MLHVRFNRWAIDRWGAGAILPQAATSERPKDVRWSLPLKLGRFMVNRPPHFIERDRLTKLGDALVERFEEVAWPILTPYMLFLEIRRLYQSGKKLYLRKPTPVRDDLERLRYLLVKANVLERDRDYDTRAYRIIPNNDRSADEVCCIADRFCYISHLSAMARYGLTDRRPNALNLTTPYGKTLNRLTQEAMVSDYGREVLETLGPTEVVPLHGVSHPETVRQRKVRVHRTARPSQTLKVRGSFARVATIGWTFADMLEDPDESGGMRHVLDVWRENAELYLEDIIDVIDDHPRSIVKVRAGYILDELLGFQDDRIQKWRRYAQRGGSRVLDPSEPFAPNYSETWMLSLNVS